MAHTNENLLISGAGVAGPALAFWLERYGFTPTVVERAPRPREGGYAFHLHGAHGIEVLKRMGVWPAVLENRREDRETIFVNASNDVIARLNVSSTAADVEPSGMQITIKRADLARVLYEHTRDRVEYLFGDSVRAIREDADHLLVDFESGASRAYDLVVGADGLHSTVRRIVFGDEARFKRYLGYCVAAYTVKDYPIACGDDVIYMMPNKVVTLFGFDDRTAIVYLVFELPQEPQCDLQDHEAQKRLVLDAFSHAGWQLPRILDAMQSSTDFYFDSVSQIRMPRWSSGRVALLGDAAYCPSLLSGYGAQLGLVGAYVLAGELNAARGEHGTAFESYERELRPLVSQKQRNPESAGRQFLPGSAFGLWIRHQLLKLLALPWVSRPFIRMTYGRLLHESVGLKEYDRTGGANR